MVRGSRRAAGFALVATAALVAGKWHGARAESARFLLVPAVTIYPGDTIAATSIVERPVTSPGRMNEQMATERAEIVGFIARRTLPAGLPIPREAVRPAYLVSRGQLVTVIYRSSGLTISGSAMALQSAVAGEQIAVRTNDTSRVLTGTIQPDSTILLGDK